MTVECEHVRSALLRTPTISPLLVLVMLRYARRLQVPGDVPDNTAGVVRQPGATPAFRPLRRQKPLPRSSSSLWGSPRAVTPQIDL